MCVAKGWKVGDHCMALYEDDGDFYEAVISRLRLRKRQQTAEVVFVGWGMFLDVL